MTRRFFTVPAALFFLLLEPMTSMAQQKPTNDAIAKVVKYCVDVVHRFPADDFRAFYYKRFDAFYNSARGTVESNGVLAGDQAAFYEFRKCMASQGFPLGSSNDR